MLTIFKLFSYFTTLLGLTSIANTITVSAIVKITKKYFPFEFVVISSYHFAISVLWGLSNYKKKTWKKPKSIPHSNQSLVIFTIKKKAIIKLAINCLVLLRCIILSQGSMYLGKQFHFICNYIQVIWFYLCRKSEWILFTNGFQHDVAHSLE